MGNTHHVVMITINRGEKTFLGANRLQIDRLGRRIFKVRSVEDRVRERYLIYRLGMEWVT